MTRRICRKSLIAICAVATLSIGVALTPAFAAGGGGGGGGHGGFGGASAAHVSGQGITNSNGPNSHDRDFGKNRAADRKSDHKSTTKKAKAKTNSNGVKALDRDKGLDRAVDRNAR